jgi:hypothetical protein
MSQVETTEATQELTVPEVTHAQPKQFTPVVYFSKGKRMFLAFQVGTESHPKEKYFDFTNNGICGVLVAQNKKDVAMIESHESFGKTFFRAADPNQIPSGRTRPDAIIGVRSAMSGKINSSLPIDAQIGQLIADSKKQIADLAGR